MALIQCPACQHLVEESATDCPRCGERLPGADKPKEPPKKPPKKHKAVDARTSSRRETPVESKRRSFSLGIAGMSRRSAFILLALLAALAGAVAFAALRGRVVGAGEGPKEQYRTLYAQMWRQRNPNARPEEFEQLLDEWVRDPSAIERWLTQIPAEATPQ